MKIDIYRRTILSIAPATLALMVGNAYAQVSGSTTVGIGWLHIMPQGKSDPATVVSVGGVPVDQKISDTGAHAGNSDAASFSVEYHFSDHFGAALLVGSPFTSDLIGDASFSQFGVIGKSRPMAPVLEARYHLLAPDATFRPFVGVGVNYTWFADTRLTNNNFVAANFGPGSSTHATLSSSWNPTFDIGATYAITKHWSLGASLTYIPMTTTLTTTATSATGAQTVTKMKIRTNPLISLIGVNYTF